MQILSHPCAHTVGRHLLTAYALGKNEVDIFLKNDAGTCSYVCTGDTWHRATEPAGDMVKIADNACQIANNFVFEATREQLQLIHSLCH